MPPVGDRRPLAVDADNLAHFFDGRVRGDDVVERQLVLVDDSAHVAATGDLPKDETQSVDIGTFERVKVVGVDCFFENLEKRKINLKIGGKFKN